jgi:UDP-2,3-diacylglucosamine hydrolase
MKDKVYFASDFHLGYPTGEASREREQKIIRWLDFVAPTASHIYLMGDLFDFWFEYTHVIPKGFIRFQAKLVELADKGVPISIFTGNHDLWLADYFTQEFGIAVYHQPISLTLSGKSFHIGHGDGLGPGDWHYKMLKKIFTNGICQWLFRNVLPVSLGMGFGFAWSDHRKKKNAHKVEVFQGENEWIWAYCKAVETKQHHDFYIFGHRHLPLDLPVNLDKMPPSRYINLGEWLNYDTYAVFDGQETKLLKYNGEYGFK